MCLAIPGQIEQIFENQGLKMARVNFGGIRKSACLQYAPDATVGSYVLVHVGFAISVIDEDEARKTGQMLELNGELKELSAD